MSEVRVDLPIIEPQIRPFADGTAAAIGRPSAVTHRGEAAIGLELPVSLPA